MKPERARMLAQGLIAGAIGYAGVVVFYAIFNLATGRPIYFTAAVLGQALLGQLASPPEVTAAPAPIFVYNGLHLVVFLILGFLASWFISVTERHPRLWYLILSLAVFVFIHIFGAVAAFAAPAREAIPLWTVLLASLVAAALMGFYLGKMHPRLRRDIRRAGDFEDPLPS